MTPTDTDRRLQAILSLLATLPPHLSIERHGDGEAIYSCRDQPIDPDRPVSHTNRQHGWQVAFVREYDSRLWPAVRALIEQAPGELAFLVALVEDLGREVLRQRAETKPLSERDRRELIRAALREASAADFESESVRRTEAASPDDLPSLSRPCLPSSSPTPPTGSPAAALSSVDAGSEGGSRAEARSPVCPDCRGRGIVGLVRCLTCAGEGLLGGGQ